MQFPPPQPIGRKMTSLDPQTQAFVIGFIACLMTAFPVAILMLIPHDGWGRHLPSNYTQQLQSEIKELKKKIDQLEGASIISNMEK